MTTRVPKHVAHDLILYAKSLKINGYFWDPKAKSAFEFARQMVSPKLKKRNPQFECTFVHNDAPTPALLTAEFLDGTKWTTETASYPSIELRSLFYEKCAKAEEVTDLSGSGPAEAAASGGKGGAAPKKGADKKAPAKK